jgi:hypothetical protein
MKITRPLMVALLLIGVSVSAWDGPATNKPVTELQHMSDQQLIEEELSVCIKGGKYGPATWQYMRTVAGVARARHPDDSYPEFSDMLAGAAAENPSVCRKAAKAALERENAFK